MPKSAEAVKLFEVPHYCEGVVFDHAGQGYVSEGETIVQFSPDGSHRNWAVTGSPNGHKVLADGTHLVCDASRHAVLHLSADGKLLDPASTIVMAPCCEGPMTCHSIRCTTASIFPIPANRVSKNRSAPCTMSTRRGKTHLCDSGLAFPNGVVVTADGKHLYVGESQRNRILVYDIEAPGRLVNRRVLADLPKKDEAKGQIDNQPDGMCLDAAGNLYVAHYGMREVQVLSPRRQIAGPLPRRQFDHQQRRLWRTEWGSALRHGRTRA